jgi:putative FmdB family regulatory protein
MPFYDYGCDECKHIWEESHMMNDEPKLSCPECESKKVTKQIPNVNGYVRGNLRWQEMRNDKNFRRDLNRDMQIHTLENNDPYKKDRPSGDAADVKSRLQRIGKLNHDNDGNYTGKKFYVNDKRKKKNSKIKT